MNLATDQNSSDRGLSRTARQFLALRDAIMARWERECRACVEGADALLSPVLTNTLPAFLDNVAEALSPGYPREDATSHTNAAAVHGGERARMTSYGPEQVVHEYQILRQCIAMETEGRVALSPGEWRIIDRSFDRAIREAVRELASEQDALRRRLAAILSHDMRTPLTVIAQGADLIHINRDVDEARHVAGKISSNARRLERMMVELLDALTTKVNDKLPLTLSEFDVAALLESIRGDYAQAGTARLHLRTDSVTGHWCRQALRRAIENLINNASKYGDGGVVSIVAAQARGRMMLSVHNSGHAIPEDRHRSIFDYFTRASDDGTVEGWGLGLPFVKRVAESHGGSIAVDSAEETGTTFLIDIPIDCRPFVDSASDPKTAR